MPRRYTTKQVFAIALAVGLVAALAPLTVEAASKIVRMAGKKGRVVAVDKAGKLSVAVRNQPTVQIAGQPAVKVPEGVAVTNQPSVRVPDGLAVTNQPAVKVPDGVAVTNEPNVRARTRPSVDDLVSGQGSRSGVGWIKLIETSEGRRVALTEFSVTAQGPDGKQAYRLEAWLRKAAEGSCDAVNLSQFDKRVLRQVVVANFDSLQLTFPDAPLVVPAAPGGLTCVGVVSISAPNGSESFAGASGFIF